MDLKRSSITADILNAISDGKVHTFQQIADEVEVSKKTVYRHIQSLSYRYPIETFRGGDNRGGVYLDKAYVYQGKVRSRDELQIIVKALKLLQETNTDVDPQIVKALINEFTPTNNQEDTKCYVNENDY